MLLNSEADILDVILPADMLVGKPVITNKSVTIPKLAVSVADKDLLAVQLRSLAPQFVLTPGAKILDADTPRDFTQPQQYTVISEDEKWQKTYTVEFVSSGFEVKFFHFSHWKLVEAGLKKYDEFYEQAEDGEKFNIWASGNAGFALTAPADAAPDFYPTFAIANGKVGTAAKLVTRSTGNLGASVGMPIAAGNLFLGNFETANAMTKPLEATHFGIQTTQSKPAKLGVWCKYKAGLEYKNNQGNILQKQDMPNIYAVLYEAKIDNDGKPVKLDGTNIMTDNSIVCIAVLSAEQANDMKVNDIETDDYKYIEIPFENRKIFDPAKQAAGKYYFTLVFSSSLNGDLFEGAAGSALCVDEVEIFDN
ncbi:hypothetical protein FACS189429_7580 [Bacteroidia bacterium]|nr:hypothetical protein FACS189429_7580 [Bacteroidia bacterium]GHV44270.1 hypothetical protein FACS1894180_5430 [Bacteroidia bacterium]